MKPLVGESSALLSLRSVSDTLFLLEQIRDDLIVSALEKGHSEREVGRAASLSGPAINSRKKRTKKKRGERHA